MSTTEVQKQNTWSGLLTKEEAAERLRTSLRHVERLVELGELAHYRVGRFIRFTESDLDGYLNKTHVAPQEKS